MTRSMSQVAKVTISESDAARTRHYSVEVVATLTGVVPSTIRRYERVGLIEPSRSDTGRTRYTDRDVERVRQIRRLCSDLGVNLAAVEVILHMRDRMLELQDELARLRRHG